MSLLSNLQVFNSGSSTTLVSALGNIFEQQQHTVLLGGRNISIDLPPQKTPCPASCKFNSTYNRYTGNGTAICGACAGQGFTLDQRQTTYIANIRHTDELLDNPRGGGEDTPAGRVYQTLIRTKTHITSLDHINQSLGATIDGFKCKLWGEPRVTGWNGELYFVVSYWQKTNKKSSNG